MKFSRVLLATAALSLVLGTSGGPGALAQSDATSANQAAMRLVTRLIVQYSLLAVRTAVDLTYDHIAVDPRGGDVVVTGLKLYPALDWDQERACVIEVERVSGSIELSFESIQARREITGVTVAPSCFMPEQTAMMAAFGYDGFTIDNMSVDLSYDLASSAASLTVQAAVKDTADIAVTAAFDYVWISGLIPNARNPYGEPRPVALLAEAEIVIENKGIFERLEPMLAGQVGNVDAVPQMIVGLMMETLGEGGTRSPTAAETAFVNNIAEEVGRFLTEKNRIVLSVAPEGGVWLDENIFESPGLAIAVLNPKASSAPLVSRALISPAELEAAISGQGATLGEDGMLRVGAALLTGLGAPRSVLHGQALLMPLAEQWNAGAALLLAEALMEEGETQQAYRLALRAAAGGESGGMTIADRLEETLGADFVLGEQIEATQSWPGAAARVEADQALAAGADIGAMRERAHAAALGKGGPRSYSDAYYWASLAAAAGDRSSAGLRESLDRRFAGAQGSARDAWKGVSQSAATRAVETWTTGGLGARVSALYGVAQ